MCPPQFGAGAGAGGSAASTKASHADLPISSSSSSSVYKGSPSTYLRPPVSWKAVSESQERSGSFSVTVQHNICGD